MGYSVYSKFDVEQHKQHFINYCEVIVDEYGKIHYAVPSHQAFLELYGAKQNGLTLDEFRYSCPKDMYCDYLAWLCKETECISCWSEGWYAPFKPNSKQKAALMKLITNNLVKNKNMCGRACYSLE